MFHPLCMDANTMKKMEKQNWAEVELQDGEGKIEILPIEIEERNRRS